MQITVELDSNRDVRVTLCGEFDAVGCKVVREDLESAARQCANGTLYLDLLDVTFIDSSGIGAIVYLFKRIRAVEGKLQIVNVRGQALELISLLRVDEAIPVSPYADPAVTADSIVR